MKLVLETFRFAGGLIWQGSGMPGRWLCLATLVMSRNGSDRLNWAGDFLLAWVLTVTIPHLGIPFTGLESVMRPGVDAIVAR